MGLTTQNEEEARGGKEGQLLQTCRLGGGRGAPLKSCSDVVDWEDRLWSQPNLTNKHLSHRQPVFSSVDCNTVTLILRGEDDLPQLLQLVRGGIWHSLGLGQVGEVRRWCHSCDTIATSKTRLSELIRIQKQLAALSKFFMKAIN